MPVLGEIAVEVTYQENTHALILYVVQGNGPALLGRSWLRHIRLDRRFLGITTVQKVLKELHQSHSGIVQMKAVARSYVWWPGLDGDLETFVRSCQKCQSCHSMPAMAPLHPWLWPSLLWQRIHVDYAGPVDGRMLLVIVYAHSKRSEVISMSSTTSERFVRTLKKALRSSNFADPHVKFMNFLLSYRSTPHSITNTTPSELFLHRSLWTRLDLLRPDLGAAVSQKHACQKKNHDLHSHSRDFFVGERVLVRNMRPVVEHRGSRSYLVQVANGVVWRRHVDHLRQTIDSSQEEEETAVPDTNVDDSRLPPSVSVPCGQIAFNICC